MHNASEARLSPFINIDSFFVRPAGISGDGGRAVGELDGQLLHQLRRPAARALRLRPVLDPQGAQDGPDAQQRLRLGAGRAAGRAGAHRRGRPGADRHGGRGQQQGARRRPQHRPEGDRRAHGVPRHAGCHLPDLLARRQSAQDCHIHQEQHLSGKHCLDECTGWLCGSNF